MDLSQATFSSFVVQWSAKIAGRRPQLKPLLLSQQEENIWTQNMIITKSSCLLQFVMILTGKIQPAIDQMIVKGYVCYIFAGLFFKSNGSTCQARKNIFYFTSKALFILKKTKFQDSTFSTVMTSSMPKHKTRNIFH